ncbi:uncharacterized protein LOC134209497 [Armigeres subalbatus]|uniref:uncharacterized protein LOC134209497 n=1 Tax=Armigeres subalbatus TaxID=124917 RepID=UPI002ED68A9B
MAKPVEHTGRNTQKKSYTVKYLTHQPIFEERNKQTEPINTIETETTRQAAVESIAYSREKNGQNELASVYKRKQAIRQPGVEMAIGSNENNGREESATAMIEVIDTPSECREATTATANKQRKLSKMKELSRELAAEKSRNIQLLEELQRSKRAMEELERNRQINEEVNASPAGGSRFEYEQDNRFSSTRRAQGVSGQEESRFYTSINQLSIASIIIPVCKPTEGGKSIDNRLNHGKTF